MSHRELTLADGRALSALRVVDLKEELEKRGLSKSGPKKDLVDRLKANLVIEKEREDAAQNTTGLPNISMQDKLAEQNPFIREYFESQAEQFHSQSVVKQFYDDERNVLNASDEDLVKPELKEDITIPVKEISLQDKISSVEEEIPVSAVPIEHAEADRITIVCDKTEEAQPDALDEGLSKSELTSDVVIPTKEIISQDIISPVEEKIQASAEPIGNANSGRIPIVFDKTEDAQPNPLDEDLSKSELTSDVVTPAKKIISQDIISPVKEKIQAPAVPIANVNAGRIPIVFDKIEDAQKNPPDEDMPKSELTTDMVIPENEIVVRNLITPVEEKIPVLAVPITNANSGRIPIVFDRTEEAQQTQSRKVRRKASTRITEEIDDLLDYGEEEKEKVETPEYVWSPRVLRLGNKFRGDYVKPQESDWDAITSVVEAPDANTFVTSSLLTTLYPEVDLIAESDVKLDERGGDSLRITRTISTLVEEDAEGLDFGNGDTEYEVDEPKSLGDLREQVDLSLQRKISTVAIQPMEEVEKELTPPRNSVTNVIIVTNLVRPFTLIQLKELLQRTGNITDIWVDKIKSKCVVKFESKDEAYETRGALHGVRWPASNPKHLNVDYTTAEMLENLRERENEGDAKPKIEEKPFQTAQMLPVREWDLGKHARERSRSPGGHHRRRSSKSASPTRKRARRSTPDTSRTRRGSRSPHRDRRGKDDTKKEPEASGKALDELFRKTIAIPCIYWLPLNPQQISEKEELRRKRMLERERRISELGKLRSR